MKLLRYKITVKLNSFKLTLDRPGSEKCKSLEILKIIFYHFMLKK